MWWSDSVMEKVGYALLMAALIAWVVLIIAGLIDSMPEGVIGLAAIFGIGVLFVKVLRDRLRNKEDDYYSKNVKK